ncbi:MAG: hypothetical protein K940chlam9_01213 [Chlamydiae bacterium]|nr:hypothetical protein [Chlamydiota bacterium]
MRTYPTYIKKLFKHGGSQAIDLPMKEFVKKHAKKEVVIEVREDGLFIYLDTLTTMESDPQFQQFIEALFQDAMEHPEQLKNLEEVWDEEWDELLEGVDVSDEI